MAEKNSSFQIRMARDDAKKYHLMRFKQQVDLQNLVQPTLRQLQEKDSHRDEAHSRKRGRDVHAPMLGDQPLELEETNKDGKTYYGRKEGGVNMHCSYYVLCQTSNGVFEAHPVDTWFDFAPVAKNKSTFTAEEAEEQYLLREKTYNYYSLMFCKKMQSKSGIDEDKEKSSSDESDESDLDKLPGKHKSMARRNNISIKNSEDSERESMDSEDSERPRESMDEDEMLWSEISFLSDLSEVNQSPEKTDSNRDVFKHLSQFIGEVACCSSSGEEDALLTQSGKELQAILQRQQAPPSPPEIDQFQSTEMSRKRSFGEIDDGEPIRGRSKRSRASDYSSPTSCTVVRRLFKREVDEPVDSLSKRRRVSTGKSSQ